jgi:hypothetical protein
MHPPLPVAAPREMKRRKGRCVLLTLPPNFPKGEPEFRGPYDSPGLARERGERLEGTRAIHHDWWVFPLAPP